MITHRLAALAGVAILASLALVVAPPRPADAADVVPAAVAEKAFVAAARGVDERPHEARILAYSTPAETQSALAIAMVAVWEPETVTCSAVGVYFQDPDSADPRVVAARLEPTERGTCWVAGLVDLPVPGFDGG
jgi:hypothetical protein